MRRAWKIFSGLFVLVIAVVIAAVVVLKNLDFNDYRALVEQEIEAATGRALRIDGALDLAVSFSPALVVERVSFANAPWGTRPDMARLRRLEAQVELVPLLSGDVRITRLVLIGLDAVIETDAQGRGNWEFAAAAPPAAAKAREDGAIVPPVVDAVTMRDVSIRYRDGVSGAESAFTIARLDLRADGLDAPLEFSVSGEHGGVPYEAAGQTGSPSAVVKGGAPLPLTLAARALGADFTVQGTVAEPRAARGLDLAVTVAGDELAASFAALRPLVPALGALDPPPIGPFALEARLTGSAAAPAVSGLKAVVGRAGQLLVDARGAITNPRAAKGLALDLVIEAGDAAPLGAAFGLALPKLPPVRLAGRLGDGDGGYAVDDLAASIGRSRVAGRLAVSLAGPRPRLDGSLVSTVLDLDELLPADDAASAAPAAAGVRVFPDTPLPLRVLKALDAGLALHVARLVAGGVPLKDVAVDLVLEGGRLAVKSFRLSPQAVGGRFEGEATLDAAGAVPALTARLTARKLDAGRLLKVFDVTHLLDARLDADVELAGKGSSVRALMAGLDGRVQVVGRDGRIDSDGLKASVTGLLDALPWVASADANKINCIVARFDVARGLATSRALVVDTNGVSVAGEGQVNLADETLDLTLVPRAKSMSLASLVLPVRVGGTFSAPTVTPAVGRFAAEKVKGVVSGAIGTATGILTAPAGILGWLLGNEAKPDPDDPCVKALAAAASPLGGKK